LPKHAKHEGIKDSIGLPVPAAAGVLASLAIILVQANVSSFLAVLLLPFMLLVSVLMVSTIPFPVFKYITWNLRTGFLTFLSTVILCALILFFSVHSIPVVFIGYLCYSLGRAYWLHRRQQKELTQ
jgi:CDP-diacylglycerol--serine O-phosphatidyltransferase